MKKILCPTDFSDKSIDTYRFASSFALSLPADLILFHASVQPLGQADSKSFKNIKDLPEGIEESNKTLIKTWQSLKNSEEKECRRSHFDFVMEEGFPLASIVRFVEKNEIDLVIMHTKSEYNEKHECVYIGSIGAQVVEEVKTSVLLVPKGVIHDNIKSIVYAIDLDSYCEECINKAMVFAKSFNAKVTFLYMGNAQHKKLDKVKSLIDNVFEKGTASVEVKEEKDYIAGINKFIKSNNVDMLVMERHRKNILEKLFSKSLISAVEKYAKIPLLILPAKK